MVYSIRNLMFVSLAVLFTAGCAKLPQNIPRPESFAYNDTRYTRIGKRVQELSDDREGLSGFRLLGNGLDAFAL